MMAAAVQTDKFLINSLVLSCLALAHRFPPARWKIFGQCERHRTKSLHVMMITKTVVMLVMKTMVMTITKTMVMTITKTMVIRSPLEEEKVQEAFSRGQRIVALLASHTHPSAETLSSLLFMIIIKILSIEGRIINSHIHPSAGQSWKMSRI